MLMRRMASKKSSESAAVEPISNTVMHSKCASKHGRPTRRGPTQGFVLEQSIRHPPPTAQCALGSLAAADQSHRVRVGCLEYRIKHACKQNQLVAHVIQGLFVNTQELITDLEPSKLSWTMDIQLKPM